MFGKKTPHTNVKKKPVSQSGFASGNTSASKQEAPATQDIKSHFSEPETQAVQDIQVVDISEEKQELLEELRSLLFKKLDPSLTLTLEKSELKKKIFSVLSEIADENSILMNMADQETYTENLLNDIVGLGPIEPLMTDRWITDIMVNGYNQVYVERRGKLQLTPIKFRNAEHVHYVAQRIANAVGRRIDESSPMVDARLADGSRVNAISSPLSLNGTCISIRKFSEDKLTFDDMLEFGSMSSDMRDFLSIASASRLNIVISGGTGAGKTSVLNGLSMYISKNERVITIEDAAELRLQQPHVVTLETRPENSEGRGRINQRDLVINALRMRPDRIIMGEVRGEEAMDMLQAMNTGHEGSMSTLHANTPREAVSRLENMLLMGNVNIPVASLRRQIASSLDLIIQAERMRDGTRRITNITDVVGMEGDTLILADLFSFEYQGEVDEKIQGEYKCHQQVPTFYDKIRFAGYEDELKKSLNLRED